MKSALVHFLDQLLQPAGFVWLLLIILGILQWRARLRRWAWAMFGVVALFSIAGGTPLAEWLLRALERPYATQKIDELPVVDAVLVLGGFLAREAHEPAGMDLAQSADRLMAGIELVRRGKARHLVMSGGSYIVDGKVRAEADDAEPWIQRWNLLNSPILRLPICTNTRDEAVALAKMMKERGWEKVLLVTSAWHMRRSEAVFRSTGVSVIPVACDFQAYPIGESGFLNALSIVPQPGKLEGFHVYCHEIIGWWYYRARGWIKPTDACCEEAHEPN